MICNWTIKIVCTLISSGVVGCGGGSVCVRVCGGDGGGGNGGGGNGGGGISARKRRTFTLSLNIVDINFIMIQVIEGYHTTSQTLINLNSTGIIMVEIQLLRRLLHGIITFAMSSSIRFNTLLYLL